MSWWLQARRDKLAFFEHHCSEVADGLMVAGSSVAADSAILKASHVSHILNCVGALLPCHFPEEFTYKVLYLQGEHSCTVCVRFYGTACLSVWLLSSDALIAQWPEQLGSFWNTGFPYLAGLMIIRQEPDLHGCQSGNDAAFVLQSLLYTSWQPTVGATWLCWLLPSS